MNNYTGLQMHQKKTDNYLKKKIFLFIWAFLYPFKTFVSIIITINHYQPIENIYCVIYGYSNIIVNLEVAETRSVFFYYRYSMQNFLPSC